MSPELVLSPKFSLNADSTADGLLPVESLASVDTSHAKMAAVSEALRCNDLSRLQLLARGPGGLARTLDRAAIWRRFLGIPAPRAAAPEDQVEPVLSDPLLNHSSQDFLAFNDLPPHKDEPQVMLDIRRLFTILSHLNAFNLESNSSYTAILSLDDIEAMRKRLFCLITRVLRTYPSLNYYQGYHDVASVVLFVCNDCPNSSDDDAFVMLEKLTLLHLRDFMISDISLTINHLKLIPLVLQHADPFLFALISRTSNSYMSTDGTYYDYKFLPALLSILTLYSHDLSNFNHLLEVFDLVLSYNSVAVSVYLYAAALIYFKPRILKSLAVEHSSTEDFEPDMLDKDLLHSLLSPSSLFADISDENLAEIVRLSESLITRHDIEHLPNSDVTFDVWFKEFNNKSVLLTSSQIGQPISASIISAKEIESLLRIQEDQQSAESSNDAKMLQVAFDNLDSMANSIDSYAETQSPSSIFSSSLVSLTAASSSLNNTLVATSSTILKKIRALKDPGDEAPYKGPSALAHFYRLSLTIGFVGFCLHFLIKQTELAPLLRGPVMDTFYVLKNNIPTVNHAMINNMVTNAVSAVREYGPVREMATAGQIGLGSLRSSIFAMVHP